MRVGHNYSQNLLFNVITAGKIVSQNTDKHASSVFKGFLYVV